MKRLPLLVNVLLFAMLCVTLTFWGMKVFKPTIRPIQAPVNVENYEPNVGQWGDLFGQSAIAQAAPSSYQLKGVIVAPRSRDSVAIIAVEGQSNFIIGIGRDLMPGVSLREVHADHVIVSESGISRRIDLPAPVPHVGIISVPAITQSDRAPGLVPPQAPSSVK
jgi:general secretion pathway protein C